MRREDGPAPRWMFVVALGLKLLSGAAFAALLCYAKRAGAWGVRDVPYWLLVAAPLAWPTFLTLGLLLPNDEVRK